MQEPVEILVLASQPEFTGNLRRGFEESGFAVDFTRSVEDGLAAFLDRGGHALLVIWPDVSTGLALQFIESLRAVDATLPVILFGDATLRGVSGHDIFRVRSFHPGSRAGPPGGWRR